MKILIIIPAYNEEANIINTVNKIKNYKKYNIDYIVINDGSTDQTKVLLESNKINYIDLPYNLGIGASVQTGYKYAYYNDYDIAIQFDGDGQHDINYIDKLIKPIVQKEADIVVGSRFIDNTSKFRSTKARQLGINIISFLIKMLSGKKLLDVTSGFRAINKNIIQIFAKNYPYDFPEPITNYALIKNGFKFKEVGVMMHERVGGSSSIKLFGSIYYMFNVCLSILLLDLNKFGRKN